MRRLLAIAVICLVVAGCGAGSAVAPPHHGILFTYAAKPTTWHAGGGVYLWTPGSSPRMLFGASDPKVDPQWSPDGTRIAWSMEPPALCKEEGGECGKFGCEDQVYVSRDGGSPVRVTPDYVIDGNQGCSDAAAWSPDGAQLLIERVSNTEPSDFAVLSLRTGAVKPLDVAPDPGLLAWGKPGIAYVDNGTLRIIDPSFGVSRTVVRLPRGGFASGLEWSSRGELATLIQGKGIRIYSSTGRKVAEFSGPRYPEAPAPGSRIVWSPNGTRLLVCIDLFGGLSAKAHEALVNTRQKRDRYPAPVPYLVDRNGTHWQRFQLPNPQPKETACDATSWH